MKVSIALASYNGGAYILDQLKSFTTQSKLPDEVIVSDDCSTDNTVELIKKFAINAPFEIKIYVNESNIGYSRNFNNALSKTTGDLIFLSDQDDVWFNTKTEEVIVVDYKSQEDQKEVNQKNYFDSPYKGGYKRQLDFYAYLLKSMGYKVSSDAYLYICNAKEIDEGFHGKMLYDELLIHYKVETDYLENDIEKMIEVLNSPEIPISHESCENCAYSRQRLEFDG